MAHAPEIRDAVRAGYVYDRLPLEQAAAREGIPHSTARKWKAQAAARGDDWDKARAAAGLSARGAGKVAELVLNDFLTMHQATVDAIVAADDIPPMERAETLARLADAFTKTMSAVAKAAPDLGRYAVASEILQDLATFVRGQFPQHAEALAEVLEPFAAHVAEKYG